MDKSEDIKEMIQREIRSIPALDERVVFKDVMEGVFLSLYEKNKEMYQVLEKRVMDDLAYDINRYRICAGLVEKGCLDVSHEKKYQGIVKIEKLVSEYNIWELHKIPYGKFKIKIYESSNHTYSGYTNLHIADGLGDYCCAVGHGKTEKTALEDTISEFFKMLERKKIWEEQDFQYADSYDF